MRTTMYVAGGLLVMAFGAADAGRAMAAPQQRHLLTGTYELQTNRGDDPRRAAEQAARSVPVARRQRTVESLLARLEAPEMIEIEREGNSITMASTRGARVTVDADGRDHSERWSADRTMNTRATLRGERLTVATTGYRGDAFTVTFEPTENGRALRMTRTIDDTDLRRPVTVRSFFVGCRTWRGGRPRSTSAGTSTTIAACRSTSPSCRTAPGSSPSWTLP